MSRTVAVPAPQPRRGLQGPSWNTEHQWAGGAISFLLAVEQNVPTPHPTWAPRGSPTLLSSPWLQSKGPGGAGVRSLQSSVRARSVRRLPLLKGIPQLSVRHGWDIVGATMGLSCCSCLRGQPWGGGVCGQGGTCWALDVHRFIRASWFSD